MVETSSFLSTRPTLFRMSQVPWVEEHKPFLLGQGGVISAGLVQERRTGHRDNKQDCLLLGTLGKISCLSLGKPENQLQAGTARAGYTLLGQCGFLL